MCLPFFLAPLIQQRSMQASHWGPQEIEIVEGAISGREETPRRQNWRWNTLGVPDTEVSSAGRLDAACPLTESWIHPGAVTLICAQHCTQEPQITSFRSQFLTRHLFLGGQERLLLSRRQNTSLSIGVRKKLSALIQLPQRRRRISSNCFSRSPPPPHLRVCARGFKCALHPSSPYSQIAAQVFFFPRFGLLVTDSWAFWRTIECCVVLFCFPVHRAVLLCYPPALAHFFLHDPTEISSLTFPCRCVAKTQETERRGVWGKKRQDKAIKR